MSWKQPHQQPLIIHYTKKHNTETSSFRGIIAEIAWLWQGGWKHVFQQKFSLYSVIRPEKKGGKTKKKQNKNKNEKPRNNPIYTYCAKVETKPAPVN